MKALKITGIAILSIVVVGLIAVLLQPANGHIEHSIVINASPEKVFTQLNDFKSVKYWSPWAKMDPEATYTYEGPESGAGAKMNWDGKKVGKGSQWIAESVENQRIKCGLAFEGFVGTASAEFTLKPEGNGTSITWTYDGANDGFSGKMMWLVVGGMLDGQYKEGLQDLKKYIEGLPAETITP